MSNEHRGANTSAVFITAEQKAAGLDPAAVANAAAAAARAHNVSQPGQRGITVQHIAGPSVTMGIPRGVTMPAQSSAAPSTPQPMAAAAQPAQPDVVLVGDDALAAAERLGRQLTTPVGQLDPVHARVFFPAAASSVSLPLTAADLARLADGSSAMPTPEPGEKPLPHEVGAGGALEPAAVNAGDAEAALRGFASGPAGGQLVVEFRGPVRLVSPVRVRVTHERDEENGYDLVELAPEGEP